MSGKEIKVTDKRIFTPEGELKEEYRFLEEEAAAHAAEGPSGPEAPAEAAGQAAPAGPEREATGAGGTRQEAAGSAGPGAAAEPRLELPGTPPGLGAPSFYDLVGLLAEPASLYLGDVQLPDGESVENLELARLHIDLLEVLRDKTAGNLTAQESALLEDLLYRLRLRYVQKRG